MTLTQDQIDKLVEFVLTQVYFHAAAAASEVKHSASGDAEHDAKMRESAIDKMDDIQRVSKMLLGSQITGE